jgi:hypothetical protein
VFPNPVETLVFILIAPKRQVKSNPHGKWGLSPLEEDRLLWPFLMGTVPFLAQKSLAQTHPVPVLLLRRILMGRRSRELQERREKAGRSLRIEELESQLQDLAGGEAVFKPAPGLSPEAREMELEDILAFESIGSGPSLFQGLQERGVDLPPPENLSERECLGKISEIVSALSRIRVFLLGFHHLPPAELYSTLWNETLWEACYVEKRNPNALTLIDVSHKMTKSEWLEFMKEMESGCAVQ